MTSSMPEFGALPESFSTETCTTRSLTIKPLQSKNCTFTGSVLPHLKTLGSSSPCCPVDRLQNACRGVKERERAAGARRGACVLDHCPSTVTEIRYGPPRQVGMRQAAYRRDDARDRGDDGVVPVAPVYVIPVRVVCACRAVYEKPRVTVLPLRQAVPLLPVSLMHPSPSA